MICWRCLARRFPPGIEREILDCSARGVEVVASTEEAEVEE